MQVLSSLSPLRYFINGAEDMTSSPSTSSSLSSEQQQQQQNHKPMSKFCEVINDDMTHRETTTTSLQQQHHQQHHHHQKNNKKHTTTTTTTTTTIQQHNNNNKNNHFKIKRSHHHPQHQQPPPSPPPHNNNNRAVTVMFRPLIESDKDTIRSLHEEWFPVRYKDDFYDSLISNKMSSSSSGSGSGGGGESLFSSVALLLPDGGHGRDDDDETEGDQQQQQPSLINGDDDNCPKRNNNHHYVTFTTINNPPITPHPLIDLENPTPTTPQIIGCIVGSFVRSSKAPSSILPLLIKNPHKHTYMFYIMTLGATTQFRKMGLGTALVERCLSVAEGNGRCGVVYLHVITYNKVAIRFYESLGFVRVTEIKDYYKIDGSNYNCYLYAKYIHGNQVHISKGFFSLLSEWVASVWNSLTFPFYSALRIE